MSCPRSRPPGEDLETKADEAVASSRACGGSCAALAGDDLGGLLAPRVRVTLGELVRMPPSLTPAEALPWTRLSRGAFYKMLRAGDVASCRLGHSIRIPTRRFLLDLGVLEEDES